MKEIQRSPDTPDFLFVEPSSQIVTRELRDVAAMGLRDVPYEIGAFLTLVDGPMFESWWEERQPLLLGQITDADLVAVSQADQLTAEDLERLRSTLKPYAGEVLPLSVESGQGVDAVLSRLDGDVRTE